MGGATIPAPGGGVGQMAFPSSAEPNPILQGLRGTGPEQIINQITPPQAPPAAPVAFPSTPAAPVAPANFSGAELFKINNPSGPQYSPIFYALQGGIGSVLNPNQGTSSPSTSTGYPNLPVYGYSDVSQVPDLYSALNNLQNQQYGSPILGTPQYTGSGAMSSFAYNTQLPSFTNYKPTYNPLTQAQFQTALQNAAKSPQTSYTGIAQMLGLKPYGT